MITYTSVHDIISTVLSNSDLSNYNNALYSDYVSYMASMNVNMNANESTTNRNLVIYLANFFNFLEQTGYMTITMQSMRNQEELKARQDKIVDDFFETRFNKYIDPKRGTMYKIYRCNVPEATKDQYAQKIKTFGMQFVKDMQPELKVTTTYSYNGGMPNATKKANVDFSSPLSAGLISKMELNQLAQNIVFEMLDTAKVKSYGNVAELSAICSSSSSSSSCSFIAYMKLA